MAIGETARLLASLELQDKFTPHVGKVLGGLDKLEGGFERLGTTAGRGLKTAGANLAGIGAIAGAGLASQVFVGLKSLEDLERVTNATGAVIESTGGAAGVTAAQVRSLAESLENVTTADDKLIEGAEGLLLTFTGIGKDVFPQATKSVVDLAIALAEGDVANADFKGSAIQIGKALNDPIKGITALSKAGVSFTEQQKKQIKTLVESGKTVEAQKIVLGELEREFGKAGKAAGTGFGADMRRVKDSIEGAQQALAVGFLPVISEASGKLQAFLAKPETVSGIKEFGTELAGAFDQALEIAEKIPWSTVGDAFRIAGEGAKATLNFFTSLPEWVQTAVLTGWGLNKLTGGAVGDIAGELGKGLIKGVLGMNAGIVNINAATVNGPGVGPTGPAPAGGLGPFTGIRDAFAFVSGLAVAEAAGQLLRDFTGLTGNDPVGPALGPNGTIAQGLKDIVTNDNVQSADRQQAARDFLAAQNRTNDRLEDLRVASVNAKPPIVNISIQNQILGQTVTTTYSRYTTLNHQTSLPGGITQI